jgi:hypothetical protein
MNLYMNVPGYIAKDDLQKKYIDKANKMNIEADGIDLGFTDTIILQ